LVVSPQEPLITGGPAEEFEARVQSLFRDGYRHLVVDLRAVPTIDSAGVRALVRGYTTAQRLHGSFRLVAPNERVRTVLQLAHLDSVFDIFESLDDARASRVQWQGLALAGGVAALSLMLVVAGEYWPALSGAAGATTPLGHPMMELAKLVAAALIGIVVTSVHRRYRVERPGTPSMEQAQVLLCVAGAMMMMIIGNSLARAFGIAGAASIVRFRTPVDDPKDITVLFLLMGLGMAAGLGALGVAGLATLFLCAFFPILDRFGDRRPRSMLVEIVADGRTFPVAHVQSVFARNGIVFEPREVSQGKEAAVQYQTTLNPGDSLEDLSAQLMAGGTAGLKSVSWEPAKRPI
jgi:anti-anti-sigma factor